MSSYPTYYLLIMKMEKFKGHEDENKFLTMFSRDLVISVSAIIMYMRTKFG